MKNIVIVCRDATLNNAIERSIKDRYGSVIFNNMPSALDHIYNSIPDLIVISVINDDPVAINILNEIKTDPMFFQLPVLAILPDQFNIDQMDTLMVEDYIWRADFERDFLVRVNLSIFRSEKNVEINPLTRLPGNISINRAIQERLENNIDFAFGYADLDYFKPFNDRYGFSRGDEVIKITGRLILGIVKAKQPQGSFVGHVGGDDFVFIIDIDLVEEAAAEIIKAFDSLIIGCYDSEDLTQGFIKSVDRKGNASQFPIMGISIGITETRSRMFSHYGEVTQPAAEMKKFAKQFKGSCFKSDRRQDKKDDKQIAKPKKLKS